MKLVPLDFAGSTLWMSPRSPFARRVRLAFHEAGLDYQERAVDVLKPTAELFEKNPIARVPVLILKSGQALVESGAILDAFYEVHESPLFSGALELRTMIKQWSVLAAGVCEKIVEYYFETLRPESSRDPEVFAEIAGIVDRVLARAEPVLSQGKTLFPHGLTQADLDLGAALRYHCLRRGSEWRKKFPACSSYLDELEKRPSFKATHPPDA
jgi:glutathione S-transferase